MERSRAKSPATYTCSVVRQSRGRSWHIRVIAQPPIAAPHLGTFSSLKRQAPPQSSSTHASLEPSQERSNMTLTSEACNERARGLQQLCQCIHRFASIGLDLLTGWLFHSPTACLWDGTWRFPVCAAVWSPPAAGAGSWPF